jgi:hypothetical protein
MREKVNLGIFRLTNLGRAAALTLVFTGSMCISTRAQQQGQKTFASPEEASTALVNAAQSNDEKALLEVFGPDDQEVVSSGDATEDAENHENFAKKYQEMHRLVKEPDGTVTLYIGAENWPAPIPLVNRGGLWYFDTEAGKMEIMFRRIGRNEMMTIRSCQELAAAQKEYYSMQNNEYAPQIYSDEGKHNGLYWKAAEGEAQSPMGPLVAAAVAEGYVKGSAGRPTPYHGYLYHVLTRQGKRAPGGAKNYIVNGKMTEGFAFVAYPAEYRSSGVMTFIVNADGVVYQKDLGNKTEAIGKTMKEYDRDSSWQEANATQDGTASR